MAETKGVTLGEILGFGELKDDNKFSKRFRDFIAQDKWVVDQYKAWLDECVDKGKGAHDPYNRAFQDIVVCLGEKLGFKVTYGRYAGKPQELGYDGLWERPGEECILLEVKSSTWPIGSVGQLGGYMDRLAAETGKGRENVFGLYVIGSGDMRPLIEQILGSEYRARMRVALYSDLIELLKLMQELESIIGRQESALRTQSILLPLESVNVGNILELILDVAKVRSRPTAEDEEQQVEAKAVEKEPRKRRGRRSLGSVPRGEYRFPILETLMEMGGEGKVLEVMTKVEERMKDRLTSVDYQTLKGGEKRWEKNAHWMRHELVKEGYLAEDSPRGIWRITDKGRALYRELKDRL